MQRTVPVFTWFNKLRSRTSRSAARSPGQKRTLACESLEDRTTPTVSTITAGFNSDTIPAGDYIWFSSEAKVSGVGSTPVTLHINNQTIDFTSNGNSYSLNVPDSTIVLDPAATTAGTSYGANGWSVSAPGTYTGNIFVSGLGWQVTNTLEGSTVNNLLGNGLGGLVGGLLGGLGGQLTSGSVQNVTWSADFSTDTSGISLNWGWEAAVYNNFTANESAIQVKTVGNGQVDTFHNSDPAGTPENFKPSLTAGARGNGGTNWIGTETSTASVQPQVIQTATAVISGQVEYYNPTFEIPPTPAAGDTVTLTDASGNVVATTTTDANGNYSFGNLPAGTYTVTECNGGTSQTVTIGDSGTTTVNLQYIGN